MSDKWLRRWFLFFAALTVVNGCLATVNLAIDLAVWLGWLPRYD